jgi:ABC-type polysaccharide/polyol phosphate export permease
MALLFVIVVAGIFTALGTGQKPVQWVYYLPLLPLALLALTGIYLFVLPYALKLRRG